MKAPPSFRALVYVLASAFFAGALSAQTPPVLAALLTSAPFEHLGPLAADPATAARLSGLTLLAPLPGPYGLPRDSAALSAWLDRHSIPGVWTLSDLADKAKAGGVGVIQFGPLLLQASETAPGGFVVIDANGNTSAVLFERPASGGALLALDRPLGALSEPVRSGAGSGAFVRLP